MDDAVVIRLAGEMDLSTAAELRRLLGAAETDTAATIVLDMSEVSFIDAHCIGVILHAWTAAEVRGQVLQVDGLRGLPARVVRLLGLESTFVRSCQTSEGNAGG
ncbi:MAG TPA: STAS domain-containing protein [Jiangellaceae bacterium]